MSQQTTKTTIPVDANNVVLFVHGFGVRYDSRGMFTDIKDSLPKDWGSVLFDFNLVENDNLTIQPISFQVNLLQSIHRTTVKKYPFANIHIIAHSQGCVITALSEIHINGDVILLAPPESMGQKSEDYFKNQPAVKINSQYFIVPRKDGTTTYIPLHYFKNNDLENAEQKILEDSKSQKLHVLQTTEDEVLDATEYAKLYSSPTIRIAQLNSDHNFTGDSRSKLISYIKVVLGI